MVAQARDDRAGSIDPYGFQVVVDTLAQAQQLEDIYLVRLTAGRDGAGYVVCASLLV